MSKVLTDPAYYTAIANAIRAKNGDASARYTPAEMAPAILALPTTAVDAWATVSGNPVSFSDAAADVSLRSCVLSLDAAQSGDGTPSADNVRPFSTSCGVIFAMASAQIGSNLLTNRDFTDGLTGWANKSSSSVVTASVVYDADMGANCMKISRGGLGRASWNGRYQRVSVTPGERYTFLVWLKKNTDVTMDDKALLQLDFYNASNTAINIENQGQTGFYCEVLAEDLASAWTLYQCYADAPAGASYVWAQISLRKNGSLCAAKPCFVEGTADFSALPLGRAVYGGTLDILSGTLTVTHGYIASYAGETLPGAWRSSMDEYTEGASPTTGAQVVYALQTPLTDSLTAKTLAAKSGENVIWTDSGILTVSYYTA